MRALIAGNWKMNTLRREAAALARAVVAHRMAEGDPGCDMLICPPAVILHAVADVVTDTAVALGGQDCHMEDAGAHTGDVSAPMLADAGCSFVIVGHSERRADHGETDAQVRAKAMAAHRHGLCPIVCVGETLAQRDAGQALAVVARQIAGSLPDGAKAADMVVAYEPVWAIGTGRTATVEQIAEMHGHIRSILAGRMPDAAGVRLLYGGSVNRGNAAEILAVGDVDGALVGGASLKADDFWAICRSVP